MYDGLTRAGRGLHPSIDLRYLCEFGRNAARPSRIQRFLLSVTQDVVHTVQYVRQRRAQAAARVKIAQPWVELWLTRNTCAAGVATLCETWQQSARLHVPLSLTTAQSVRCEAEQAVLAMCRRHGTPQRPASQQRASHLSCRDATALAQPCCMTLPGSHCPDEFLDSHVLPVRVEAPQRAALHSETGGLRARLHVPVPNALDTAALVITSHGW